MSLLPVSQFPDGFASGAGERGSSSLQLAYPGTCSDPAGLLRCRTFCVSSSGRSARVPSSSCTICTLLQEEEDLRIREFIGYTGHKLVAQWLQPQTALCMVHGAKLKPGAPPGVVSGIKTIHGKVSTTTRRRFRASAQ